MTPSGTRVRYQVEIGGRSVEVEIEEGRVTVDGRAVPGARLTGRFGEAARRLVRGQGGTVFQAVPGSVRGAWVLSAGGVRLEASVLDARDLAVRAAGGRGGKAHGGGVLKAPMPGLVVRVLVAEGDHVSAGQGLVVVEAMKMENELRATADGVVRRVAVTPGSRVERGAVLLDVG